MTRDARQLRPILNEPAITTQNCPELPAFFEIRVEICLNISIVKRERDPSCNCYAGRVVRWGAGCDQARSSRTLSSEASSSFASASYVPASICDLMLCTLSRRTSLPFSFDRNALTVELSSTLSVRLGFSDAAAGALGAAAFAAWVRGDRVGLAEAVDVAHDFCSSAHVSAMRTT